MDQVVADTLQQIATSLAAQAAQAAEVAAEQRGRFCLGPLIYGYSAVSWCSLLVSPCGVVSNLLLCLFALPMVWCLIYFSVFLFSQSARRMATP